MAEGFTYEKKDNKTRLETYEWDNLWWQHAEDPNPPRVLIIGDSISCGYRRFVNELGDGKFYADGVGTSKAADNPAYIPLIDYFASQMHNIAMIQINFGLHGFHLADETGYKEAYEKAVAHIKAQYPDKTLFIVLTTPLRVEDNLSLVDPRNDRVLARNRVALEIAEAYDLPVIDLYSPIENSPEAFKHDGVHLTDEAYGKLAEICVVAYRQAGLL